MACCTDSFDRVYATTAPFPCDLSVNVNPLGPSPYALEAQRAFCGASLYPGESYARLKSSLARFVCKQERQILLGAGLDGLLHDFVLTFLDSGKRLLMPEATFQNPAFSARIAGCGVQKTPMLPDLQVDFDALLHSLDDGVGLVFLCHPNNPTGLLEDLQSVRALLETTNALVLLDEANIEYSHGQTGLSLLDQYPNAVLLRSFSKAYGLAGMRIGYALASRPVVDRLSKSRPPFAVGGLACDMARAALLDQDHLRASLDYVHKEREFLASQIGALGFEALPSDSNTLLVKLPPWIEESSFLPQLNAKGCHAVCGSFFGLSSRYFRLAPRRHEVNVSFVEVLREMALQ